MLNVERSTESYDNMGPIGVDERWEAFGSFHDYLLQSFPLTYVTITVFEMRRVVFIHMHLHQSQESYIDEGQHIRIALRVERLGWQSQTASPSCPSR